jgi:hypothetical protein
VLASAKAARELADGVIAALGGPLTVSEVSAWYQGGQNV